MNFLSPFAFYFAATIPVVVVFYLLKRKRVVKLVSSTMLWQRFLAETQANAPFQKLRHNWLLILQLLLLVLAILALSRPYLAGKTKTSSLRVIILDASASMRCTDVAPSRFAKARAEALGWVDSLRDQDQMMVLLAGASTEVKQSATSNKAALRRAIESCSVTDSSTRLSGALKLAEVLTRDRGREENAEVHLFSDGAAEDLSEFENKAMKLVYHCIGTRANNLGIITLDLRENPENRQQRAIYTSVANYSPTAQSTELELRFDDQAIEVRPLTVPAGQTVPQVFIASQTRDGVFSVRLNSQDDLATDNQASMVSLMPHTVKVLLVTRGDPYLQKALRAAANVELTVASDVTDAATEYDLVALDDVLPSVWPKGNLLAIHVAQTNWFEGATRLDAPAVVDWRNTHALLRYVNFDNVMIRESMGVKTPPWAVSLVDAQKSPLILAGELARQRIVWIGFDVMESNWPLRISFPIFIANAVEWLNPASVKSVQLMVHAGEPFRYAPPQAANPEVIFPDGKRKTLEGQTNTHEIVFGDTAFTGIYRLRAGTNETAFCVNLLDATESNTRPRTELNFGKYTKVSATTVKRANLEIWRWIALLGLGVLMFEWWYYHRRTA